MCTTLNVGRGTDHDQALLRSERHCNHVAGKVFCQSYAGVEAVFDNIDKAIFGDDVHRHLGIATHIFEDYGRENLLRGADRHVEPEQTGR